MKKITLTQEELEKEIKQAFVIPEICDTFKKIN
jgi:hypothetical protein